MNALVETMQTPLLTTKLYLPTPPATALRRPLLLQRLDRGLQGKLTLLAAPAGFGKSTLVSQWVRTAERPATWLTLDEHDNHATRFLSYLIGALRQIEPAFGRQTLALLAAPQPPPRETLLTTLVNETAHMAQPALLVLDDYHLIENGAIHQLLNFLLTYLPPQLHLVLITRREPPLALARLRASGELTELHAADLRFSASEVADFFAKTVEVPLPPDALATLERRTEGWAAGLRLAAVLLQSTAPTAQAEGFATLLAGFRGDDRHVLDYLATEVFAHLSVERQHFLVQTALLQRLCAPLCDALLARDDSQAQLEELARENLFLLPLDNQRQWYRYHPLFADFLRHRLQQFTPTALAKLHSRAAAWYGAHDLVEAAIDHALAAQETEQAAALIEANVLRLALGNESARLGSWLQQLPLTLRQTRPLLAFAQAGTALLAAQFVEASQWVEWAEQALAMLPPATALPLPATTIQGYLDALRCTAMINLHEPVTAIIAIAQRALVNLPATEIFLRGAVALNLGDAYARQRENGRAAEAFAEAVMLTQATPNLTVYLAALGSQGELYAREGKLAQAAAAYQRALDAGQAWGKATGQSHPTTGKAHAFYAQLLYEWNRIDEATAQARAAVECCQRWGHTQHLVDSYLALCNSTYAQGRLEEANAALAAARLAATASLQSAQEQHAATNAAYELIETIDLAQLQLWLRQGRLADAAQWLATHATRDSLAHGFAHTRLALAQDEATTAAQWLAKTKAWLAPHLYPRDELTLLLLEAQLHQQQGRPEQALARLQMALDRAAPAGYIRALLDEGPAVVELLYQLVQRTGVTDYIQSVLTAAASQANTPVPPAPAPPATLVEPLSEREWEVLRLMAADFTYAAIGETLIISLNTVRTHTKNIYSKLNVNRRNQAIARARALGLL